ncbi:T9SS type A sorting domain-containing protein, partial [bacterium]|nr:T9SS type A sorting domain-containing protein [bacterium]
PYAEMNISADGNMMLDIPLQGNYFELISTNLTPADMNAGVVFGDVAGLVIAYQNDGGVYIPPFINTIGDIDVTQAYRLFCEANSELVIDGTPVDPMMEFNLFTQQWNWMAYPLQDPVSITTALSPIADVVDIVNTDEGQYWIPNIINILGDMQPGKGYLVYVSEDVTFQYNQGNVARAADQTPFVEVPTVEGAPSATGLPYAVVVSLNDNVRALDPATIELYDGSTLIGKGVVLEDSDYTPLTAWEGSEEHNVDGFTAGNKMTVVVRSSDGSKLPVTIAGENDPVFGKGAYTALSLESTGLPTVFAVDQGYPNPFNPTITVPFAMPIRGEVSFAVYNILGQQVFQTSGNYGAGYHRFHFDAAQSGMELVSGMYFLRVEHNAEVKTQKIMLLK